MPRKQHDANRRNAQRSKGPISELGKTNTSRNAVKHGLSGVPVLTPSERTRWLDIRVQFYDLADETDTASSDIDDCATAQVLLERLMGLRHQAFEDGASNDNVSKQLLRLVRHENRLIKRRDRLLHRLDIDEYSDFDPFNDLNTNN